MKRQGRRLSLYYEVKDANMKCYRLLDSSILEKEKTETVERSIIPRGYWR